MAMPVHVPDHDWTVERALALPEDGNRYEVLDGELFVTPAPTWRHQSVLEALHARLRAYVTEHRLGWTRFSPADIVFSPRRLLQPDLFVVPWKDGGPPRTWADVRSLLLAVEVLSPSTARADRHRKRLLYQNEGVSEYWIVDGDARLVERWRPGDERPEMIIGSLTWRPRAELPPFELPLDAFFDEASS
jgi:Uma2 family endonuclease